MKLTSQALPVNFEEFNEARRNGFLKVKGIKDSGQKVAGVFCTYTPMEVLDAAGFTPVGLCGMSPETIPDAEAHLPKNLCPLIKSSYGFAVSDKCPYTYFSDLIVGETTCDGKKKMYELLGEIKKTYILHLPQGLDGDALNNWTKEVHRFIDYLEKEFDVEITEEALRQAARMRNEERLARLELMEMQKMTPPPAGGRALYAAMDGASFLFDPQERVDSLRGLAEKTKVAYASGERPISEDAKRILITGCPIGGVLDKAVSAIEEKGGVVVCFENCGGIKPAYQMVDPEAEDIVGAIATRYLDIGCSIFTPNPNRMTLLERLVEEYQVDGVVELDLQACHTYIVESHTIKQLMQKLNMPYMQLETDYSQSDKGQIATRLEAFLERL